MPDAPPRVLVVMGVSGSGKTTIAALLAGRLGWRYEDGDDFHPPSNVAKMHDGTPLTDADRWPWLRAIAAWIDETRAGQGGGVVACSALRRAYRDILLRDRPDVRLVYLRGDQALIARRQAARRGHFMPPSLIESQFAALEEPGPDERPILAEVEQAPSEVVDGIIAQFARRFAGAGDALSQDAMKRQAAEAAVAEVEDGMVLGLGTGSTAALAVEALAVRVRDGLRVVGIPTSERTAAQARGLGIPLASFAEHQRIDLTIDGADEVQRGALGLIKGLGGALLWEKIVAANSARMTVMVDESKLVDRLGERCRLPVEVVPFGWQATAARLRDAGLDPALRGGDNPYRTDSGNLLLDCAMAPATDPAALQRQLKAITGVVETGLFIGIATRVIVGAQGGPQVLQPA